MSPGRRRAVTAYVVLLAGLAAAVAALVPQDAPPLEGPEAPLPRLLLLVVLALLVTLAERSAVRYRMGGSVDSINLVEAALAPLLVAVEPLAAVLAVVAGQALAGAHARNEPLKTAFNAVQWGLATACGAAVVAAVGGTGLGARTVVGLLLALLVVALVNNAAFAGVLAVSGSAGSPREVLRRLAPLLVPAWTLGLGLNVAVGLLHVMAYAGSPAAVLLFAAPLLVLRLAYRGQAEALAERGLVAGLHRSGSALSTPVDPRDALGPWLAEVAATFEARAVLLGLERDGLAEVHRWESGRVAVSTGTDALLAALAPLAGEAVALEGTPELRAAGWENALVAPLREGERRLGLLVVLDRAGLEVGTTSEVPVAAALAREAAGTLAKGRLLARALEERRTLDELVGATSDGILSLDADGVVRSWNPALERLTGLAAADVVDAPGALDVLHLRTDDGAPLALRSWTRAEALPVDLVLDGDGGERRVACSYSVVRDEDGTPRTLVVVARDLTPAQEVAALRAQFRRLVEAEAAQRVVVEHLQAAVMPPLPALPGCELGVRYVASDPSQPTGGDLYDVQVLPDGTVHLAVVDVLGHGVAATQAALAVAHTLRTVVLDGTPLEDVVARADALLGRHDPDLVATVVLARYEPASGRLRLAAGGHPPPLVVGASGVREHEVEGGPVGWPLAGSREVAETRLEPGEVLVLYTDGLVEARKDVVAGLADLRRLAAGLADQPAPAFAQGLVDAALRGADRRDDTLALVLRRLPVAVGPPQQPLASEATAGAPAAAGSAGG